jgi:SAM-dependent methyltransferase
MDAMSTLFAPLIYTDEPYSIRAPFLGDISAIDIGCGGSKLPGARGMDMLPLPPVDVVHDMNVRPWPLEDNSHDLVFMNHALEHVREVVPTMSEIYRVLKPGGHAVIQVPYFRSVDAFTDPTHLHFFSSETLDYFIRGSDLANYQYTEQQFKVLSFWFGWPNTQSPIKRWMQATLGRHKKLYDGRLSLIAPVKNVTWELEKPAEAR